jgi:hypothetical protein
MEQNLVRTEISIKITFGTPQEKMHLFKKDFQLPFKLSIGDVVALPLYSDSEVISVFVDPVTHNVQVTLQNINIKGDNHDLEENDKSEFWYNDLIKSFKSEGWK